MATQDADGTCQLNSAQIAQPLALNKSVLIGLLGRGLGPSHSPRMHEREGMRLGFNYVYKRLDFDVMNLPDSALPEILERCVQFGFSGINVTLPFKQAVVPHLDELSDKAHRLSAVNTVRFVDGRAIGHNTDCWGFAESFRQGLPQAICRRVVLVGAGGAGRAVLHALLDLGAEEVTVFDQTLEAAQSAVDTAADFDRKVEVAPLETLPACLPDKDGVVNATPMGMAKYPGTSIPLEDLSPRHWVADIVYFPEETKLLRGAREKGCATLPGGGMAVYQAVRAFELFTGTRPDAASMSRFRNSD